MTGAPLWEHVYLHVPFCRMHCGYCDYAVTTELVVGPSAWRDAVAAELRMREGLKELASPLRTLLVGGGTPSVLGPGLGSAVRILLGEERVQGIEEWTIEANPEDLSAALLGAWRDAGVTRVNVGVQSLRPGALEWLGRPHSVAEAEAALRQVERMAFPSWSVDILYGLPPHVDPDPLATVREVVTLGAPHLSVYELAGGAGPEDERADQYLAISSFLRSEGYEAYEMMGFARPGHVSLHGVAVLRGESFLGLGPSAHSRLLGEARWNLRDWRSYRMSLESGVPPEEGHEEPGPAERRLEYLWRGLRLAEGLVSDDLTPAGLALARRWVRSGLAQERRRRIGLTPKGWLRLDELVVRLDRVEASGGIVLGGVKLRPSGSSREER